MEKKTKVHISAIISTLLIWLGIGTIVYHNIENWNWIQAFYFSVATLTTVGYGDLVPTNDMSMLFTSFYILFGVAIVLTSLGMIGSRYIKGKRRILYRRKR